MKSLVISENFYHLMSLLNIEVAKMVIRDAGFFIARQHAMHADRAILF